MIKKHKRKSNGLRLFFWHRYTGLFSAFIVILLSVTGILLNHTQELSLNKHYASTPWLMGMYGIKTPEISQAYAVIFDNNTKSDSQAPLLSHWVLAFDADAYLDQKILNCKAPLVGVLYVNDVLFIANATQLCLFTTKGEMIDGLPMNNGQTIKRIGQQSDHTLVLDTTTGLFTINQAYTRLLATNVLSSPTDIVWSKSTSAPESVTTALLNHYKGDGLPWERIVLDLHSGRIVGLAGVYFMDFIAVLLIFLAFSGVTLWAKRTLLKRKR